jgi:hypothetical protein
VGARESPHGGRGERELALNCFSTRTSQTRGIHGNCNGGGKHGYLAKLAGTMPTPVSEAGVPPTVPSRLVEAIRVVKSLRV